MADERPDADIELAPAEQQRSLDVLLHNEGAVLELFWLLAQLPFFLLILCYLI